MGLNTLIVHKITFTSFTCCHSVLEEWADVESTLGMWLAVFLFLMKNYTSHVIEYTKYLDLNEKQKIKEAKWEAGM